MTAQPDTWRASLIAEYEAAAERLQKSRHPLAAEMVKTLRWTVEQLKGE